MSYQALLFCADEKLARVVTQVFTELEFNVEPVNEPFSAVKKLMAQHYDALVVDCENEQNASLLFKSARNSSTNQNSLALALVEGQAGVAKAYRIGANLVLTKPINVEQAKGTLRVARGLLRKNADATASTATTATVPAPISPKLETPGLRPSAFAAPEPPAKAGFPSQIGKAAATEASDAAPPSAPAFATPQFEAALPAIAASAKTDEPQPPVSDLPAEISAVASPSALKVDVAPPPPSKPTPVPAIPAKPAAFGSFQSAAAAPAPAKDLIAPAKAKVPESELFETSSSTAKPPEVVTPPTFSALGDQTSESSAGSKKFLVIAAVLVVAIGLGYFGWTKFGSSSPSVTSQSMAQKSQPVPAPATNPSPAPAPSNLANETTPVAPAFSTLVASAPQSAKTHPAVGSVPVTKIAAATEPAVPEVVTKNFESAPIRVKGDSHPVKAAPSQSDDTTSALPNPLAVGSSDDHSLASLVTERARLPVAPVGTLTISQGVSQGLLIKKVQPAYPQNARAMRIEGPVQMQALIDKEGKITNLKVVKGQPVLAHAAAEAVRQWRYKPYYLDGQPVEIQTEITVMFKLPN